MEKAYNEGYISKSDILSYLYGSNISLEDMLINLSVESMSEIKQLEVSTPIKSRFEILDLRFEKWKDII